MWLAAAAVTFVALVLHGPPQQFWPPWPDSKEYLLIANAWVHGSGFVDPVQWFELPGAGVVVPAFAVRAPVVPALVALGFRLGASVPEIVQAHAIWSAAVVGLLVVAASRTMRLSTSVGAALWIGIWPAFLTLSNLPMTETTAVAAVVAVTATLRRASVSVGGAGLCGALTILAWMTRPNLAGMALAGFVALALAAPPGGRLRSRTAWTYLATCVVGFVVIGTITEAWTGFAPYAGYARLGLMVEKLQVKIYSQKLPENMIALIAENPDGVLRAATGNARDLASGIFLSRAFGYVGWIGTAGVLWCLWGGRRASIERRFLALCALGFALGAVLTLGFWDATRYPLLSAVAAGLCGAALLDDIAGSAGERIAAPGLRRIALGIPALALIVATIYLTPPFRYPQRRLTWPYTAIPERMTVIPHASQSMRALCESIPPDVLVASPNPWLVSFWCGNPAIILPIGFDRPPLRARMIAEHDVGFIVEKRAKPVRRRAGGITLRVVAESPRFTLLRVDGIHPEGRWNAPPPVACAGRGDACLAKTGRVTPPRGS